jgi:hypothetical protein
MEGGSEYQWQQERFVVYRLFSTGREYTLYMSYLSSIFFKL